MSKGQLANVRKENGFMNVSAEDGGRHVFGDQKAQNVQYFILQPYITLKAYPITIQPMGINNYLNSNKMRYFLGLLLLSPIVGIAQNVDSIISKEQLIGVWQLKTPKIGDALHETFQFFKDGQFAYNFSQYDDVNRVLTLNGNYRLVGNQLYTSVTSREELTGGYFTTGSPGFQSSPFVLEGATVTTISQNDSASKNDYFFISSLLLNKAGRIISIQINGNKYYKLSDNPRAFSMRKAKR